jgi:HPt (histidine-containing phosphotransfer) domain-containing protein
LESRKRDIGTLKDALTRKDFAEIVRLSHKTKGTAGGYGFSELGSIAENLETAAKSENLASVRSAIEAMRHYLSAVEITP